MGFNVIFLFHISYLKLTLFLKEGAYLKFVSFLYLAQCLISAIGYHSLNYTNTFSFPCVWPKLWFEKLFNFKYV